MDFTVLCFGTFVYYMVALGAFFAYRDGWLTANQMLAQGINQGLPWWNHGGMRGDLILMNPLVMYAVVKYRHEWNWKVFAVVLVVCFIAFNQADKNITPGSGIPQSHYHDGYRTPTGWVHVVYAAVVFAVIAMLFFSSPSASWKVLAVASVIIVGHMWWGMQGDLKLFFKPSWYPLRWSVGDTKILLGIAAVTGGATLWKALW